MGREVVAAVLEADDMVLSAQIDLRSEAIDPVEGSAVLGSVAELDEGLVDVLVDFSVADAARSHLADSLRRGLHLVVGTTGLNEADIASLEMAAREGSANAVLAANFAIGAVLLMRFAAEAARYFEGVEIIELHHDKKIDAPSGTAMATAEHIAAARRAAGLDAPDDPTTTALLEGARGGKAAGGISIHSVRLPGLVAHEEVIFGGPGQGLTLRHDSYDRRSFMTGVLLAIRAVGRRPGITVGLEPLLTP